MRRFGEIQEDVNGAPSAPDAAPGDVNILEQLTEDALLRRAARGDQDAFTVLYRRHQAALYRFALRMTGQTWAAEEIVQDVFMTLLRAPKKYEPQRGALGAFLFGIARNRILKHLERAPRETSLDQTNGNNSGTPPSAVHSFTPAHWAEQQQRAERVRAAVLDLPPEFREAVVLCELEELSYEEAAQLLGCPIGTIRSRLYRARALLLAKLEVLREQPSAEVTTKEVQHEV